MVWNQIDWVTVSCNATHWSLQEIHLCFAGLYTLLRIDKVTLAAIIAVYGLSFSFEILYGSSANLQNSVLLMSGM